MGLALVFGLFVLGFADLVLIFGQESSLVPVTEPDLYSALLWFSSYV